MVEHDDRTGRTSGMTTWRAGCGGSRTSGSEGGPEKPTRRKTGRALRSDPYTTMSVASFVAAQRTDHGVPHAVTCRALELSESWFYKWRDRPPTRRQARRVSLDAAVRRSFEASGGRYGSPRVLADLLEAGWRVSKKTVEASMARQGLVARPTAPASLLDPPGQGGTSRPRPGQAGLHGAGDQHQVVR